MCKIVSLIILLQCSVDFICNAVVTRNNTDTFTPLKKCVGNECGRHKGYCLNSYGSCCERCSCDNGLTFFEDNGNKKCIKAIGHKEACHYHLRGSQKSHQKTIGVMVKENSSKKIGFITTTNVNKAKLSDCSILTKDSKYWHVFSSWQPLFKDGRKIKDFSIGKERVAGNNTYATLNFQVTNIELISQYKGLLVKLTLRCTEKTTDMQVVRDSCLVFKILGTKSYKPITEIQTTEGSATKSPIVSLSTTITPEDETHEVLIIVFVSLFSISIIIAAVFIYLWRRKRKPKEPASKLHLDSNHRSTKKLLNTCDDDVYHDPALTLVSNGKPVKEVANPSYMDPTKHVDQTLLNKEKHEYQDPDKFPRNKAKGKKSDDSGKYDYPQIEVMPMTKSAKAKQLESPSKHIYADVSTDELPNHPYTDPDKYIVSRKVQLQNAGYASIDEEPSIPGYASIDDSGGQGPRVERYASLDVSVSESCNLLVQESEHQGYAELDKSTLRNDVEPKYFELEKESKNEALKNDLEYFELEDEEPI